MADLYEYYATKKVRPTYASFDSDDKLLSYAKLREHVFWRLMLTPSNFDGKRLLEFGPDTGENSMVFARWGATLTLVEPSVDAHGYIQDYFSKFGLDASLEKIAAASLLEYAPEHRFDVVDAEGFIYTVQPTGAWVKKLGECLNPGGIAIVTYLEFYGGFFELLLKAIYQSVLRSAQYEAGIETARRLFLPKWNSVAHTRKIESWFMDVIENPFVRLKYFIDPVDLLKEMDAHGFRLYSSWPGYKDALDMHWIKKAYSPTEELAASIAFVEQSRLSHFLSEKCFLSMRSEQLTHSLRTLVQITDGLIDEASDVRCSEAIECVESVQRIVQSIMPIAATADLTGVKRILAMVRQVFLLIREGQIEKLIEFCRSDPAFISTWGMPNHHAVFQYRPNDRDA